MKNILRGAVLAIMLQAVGFSVAGCRAAADSTSFRAEIPPVTRYWIGPEYWSNPLQDWRISDGRIECITSAANRNVSLLTHEIDNERGTVAARVRLGLIEENDHNLTRGWAGFRVGSRGQFDDYRDTAVFGRGLNAGMTTAGGLFIGTPHEGDGVMPDSLRQMLLNDGVVLHLEGGPDEEGHTDVRLRLETRDGHVLSAVESSVPSDTLAGGLALVADYDTPPLDPFAERTDHPSFWFSDWQIDGSRVRSHADRTFGPILFALHTLSEGTLNLSAQLPPVSAEDGRTVRLQVQEDGNWQDLAEAKVDELSRTATFRIPNWRDSLDVAYRLHYGYIGANGQMQDHLYEGMIRKDPVDKEEIVVAGFTGNSDTGFPHADMVAHVEARQPDILLFTGDQIYERVGGHGYIHGPLEKSLIDYLRKWYLFGWEFGALTRDIPTVAIPDDHDVYHGNLWGAGGRATERGGTKKEMQDSGGFLQPPEWVNAVQRTQTSHLPAPYDSTPVQQDIDVYYTDLSYGGISFAIVEDRKWKSAPRSVLPDMLEISNGWAGNAPLNPPEVLRAPDAELLGERQLLFLEDWAADWSNGTWMKMLVSQTIFANVATLPDSAIGDMDVRNLPIPPKDAYVPNDRVVQDMDSNGWPKEGRDAAVRTIRKAFAFHLAGDQHLGSTIQYGVDTWGDAGYALCVPSIANYYPRRWYPPEPGHNRPEGAPRYAGDFLDGFGNHMTVLAVSNPFETGVKPSQLYDRAPGYGIVRLNRRTREIEIANWPRHVDPRVGAPYDGWPITIHQLDNYGRDAVAWLPAIEVAGMEDPVVQIIDETADEIVYSVRIKGVRFEPKVFREGLYTVRVGDPDGEMVERNGVPGTANRQGKPLGIVLSPP